MIGPSNLSKMRSSINHIFFLDGSTSSECDERAVVLYRDP
jgi:hypothetical protein